MPVYGLPIPISTPVLVFQRELYVFQNPVSLTVTEKAGHGRALGKNVTVPSVIKGLLASQNIAFVLNETRRGVTLSIVAILHPVIGV